MVKEKLNEKMYLKHLENGLDVILIPKEGAIKNYAVYGTHFGSLNNKFTVPGESVVTEVPDGVAHFLEHKLFEEEDGVNALDKLSKIGANANAYTSFNHTAYLFEGTENFEKALDILISFVQNPYLTDENVEKEKGIIGQEIKMYDDDPEWQLFFNFLKCLYGDKHALTIDIAGTVESISEITPDILYRCYHTFYDPSNMVMCVVGDFDVEHVFDFIEKRVKDTKEKPAIKRYYGEIPTEVKKSIERKMDISMPMFMLGFRDDSKKELVDSGYEKGNMDLIHKHIALEIIFEMLLGKSSKFYEELYNEGLVKKEFGTDYTFEENYAYSSISNESASPEQVIEMIKQRIEELKRSGLDENEFQRIKRMLYGEYVYLFNDVTKIGSVVISDYFKGVNSFDYVDAYKDIEKFFVEQVLQEHFDFGKMAVSIIRPQ
ncbi:MAG: insulinase family protein [Clostridia bacterium]|nr:insulinase family protein [Clostridia bacterium]